MHISSVQMPWPLQPWFCVSSSQKEHGSQASVGEGAAAGHAEAVSAAATGEPSAYLQQWKASRTEQTQQYCVCS